MQINGPDGDTFAPPSLAGNVPGPADPLILIDNIFEDTDPPANGFTILLERQSIEVVAHRSLVAFSSVLRRLGELEKNVQANEQSRRALEASRAGTEAAYVGYLSYNRAAITSILAAHLKRSDPGDSFNIMSAANEVWSALTASNAAGAAAANTAITERLDADLSFRK